MNGQSLFSPSLPSAMVGLIGLFDYMYRPCSMKILRVLIFADFANCP